MEAVVKARSIVSIAGMTKETGGVDVEKNSVPSFKIYMYVYKVSFIVK